MFGPILRIKKDDLKLTLRPPRKEEMSIIAGGMSLFSVMKYISLGARPVEDREKWYDAHIDRFNGQKNDIVWVIQPDKSDKIVGVSSIFDIKEGKHGESGITIFNQNWWGKGVGSLVHLAQMAFCFDQLNLSLVYGSMVETNIKAIRSAERLGYIYTGKILRNAFVDGKYHDVVKYVLINPNKVTELYRDDDIPDFVSSKLDLLKEKLKLARSVIEYV